MFINVKIVGLLEILVMAISAHPVLKGFGNVPFIYQNRTSAVLGILNDNMDTNESPVVQILNSTEDIKSIIDILHYDMQNDEGDILEEKKLEAISDLGKPGDKIPELGTPGGQVPESGKPGGEKPESGNPGGEKPESGNSGGEKPESENPGGEEPESTKPGEEKPELGKPGDKKPESGKPGDKKPESGTTGQKPESGKPGSEKPESGKPGGGKPESEKPGGGSGRPGSGKPGGDKPTTVKPVGSGKDENGKDATTELANASETTTISNTSDSIRASIALFFSMIFVLVKCI